MRRRCHSHACTHHGRYGTPAVLYDVPHSLSDKLSDTVSCDGRGADGVPDVSGALVLFVRFSPPCFPLLEYSYNDLASSSFGKAYTYDVRASVRIAGPTLAQFATVVKSSVASVLEARMSATLAGTAFYRPYMINITRFAYASSDAAGGWGRRRLAERSAVAPSARRRAAALSPIDCYFHLWFYDEASADFIANDLEVYLRNSFGSDLDAAVPSISLSAVVQSQPIVDTTANAAASGSGNPAGAVDDVLDIVGASDVDSLHVVLVLLLVLSSLVVPLTVVLVAAAFTVALVHVRRSHAVEIERVRRESQVEMVVAAHVVGNDGNDRRTSEWELNSGIPTALLVAPGAPGQSPIVEAVMFQEEQRAVEEGARPAVSGRGSSAGGGRSGGGETQLSREDSTSLLKAAAQPGDDDGAARAGLQRESESSELT